MDGQLYLPSSAFFSVGGDMAKERGESWTAWEEGFAQSQGMAQALLLIRYGLEMKFPHRQNTLQQLSPEKAMTGNVVVRDMSDTTLVRGVATIIAPEAWANDKANNYETSLEGYPNEQPIESLPNEKKERLAMILKRSYYQTIADELGLDPQAIGRHVGSQPDFQEALRAYHLRLGQKARN
jgi:hypothetical protein